MISKAQFAELRMTARIKSGRIVMSWRLSTRVGDKVTEVVKERVVPTGRLSPDGLADSLSAFWIAVRSKASGV